MMSELGEMAMLEVSQSDIDHGVALDCQYCPLAIAATRKFITTFGDGRIITAGTHYISVLWPPIDPSGFTSGADEMQAKLLGRPGNERWSLGFLAAEFVKAFDDGKEVKPGEFALYKWASFNNGMTPI